VIATTTLVKLVAPLLLTSVALILVTRAVWVNGYSTASRDCITRLENLKSEAETKATELESKLADSNRKLRQKEKELNAQASKDPDANRPALSRTGSLRLNSILTETP
jgi:hypothetical protein